MRPTTLLAAASLALLAPGCASTCEQACENLARVCEAQFAAAGVAIDQAVCSQKCEDNVAGCPDVEGQSQCLADARTCEEAQACPACAP